MLLLKVTVTVEIHVTAMTSSDCKCATPVFLGVLSLTSPVFVVLSDCMKIMFGDLT
jgi:hypothetical protein